MTKTNKKFPYSSQIVSNVCVHCSSGSHFGLFVCDSFLELPIKEKWDGVKKYKLCFNCLKKNKTHHISKCRAGVCKFCSKLHNSILCSKNPNNSKISNDNKTFIDNTVSDIHTEDSTISSNNAAVPAAQAVLLPTAIVYVKDINGAFQKCRVLIDSASQGSFVRKSCVNLLQLKPTSVNINVDGLSSRNVGRVSGLVQLEITTLFCKNTSITVDALILPKIPCDLPQFQVDASALNAFKNLQLADINCLQPSSIDILLGADVFGEIMLNRHLNVPGHSLTATETIFGWVVLGKTKLSCQRIISNHASYNTVEFQLDKFWQLEELSETKPFTNEEIAGENHFKITYTRDSTGRFAVKFPFRDSSDELGSSRDIAMHRLQQIERRFRKNQSLSDQYHKFMDDYLKLGHMELIPEKEIDLPASSSFYLTHHPVANKNGDKFRVVFDGSAKSSSGISLNDELMVGPQLQTDLITLLLRFRVHKIAITAHIEKMYRQITLHDSDFQRIVWRNSPFEPIQDFRLTRIAYGTASAPYLAIKCLQQLALNESNNFPLASKAALKDFYVDDLMSGANSLSEALELQNQLTQMLSSAGLVLRKWASNCNELLNSIDSGMRLSTTSLNIDNDDTVKTLGILWHPASDVFYFKITPLSFEGTLTKRTLLSTIAKTFDPLGWLSPITIQYKTIMEKLWKQQLQWDERVPTDIKLEWEQLANDVQFVKDIKIPRFLLVDSDNQFHLFGFSDASEKAYAATIYCRSVSDTGKINVQLIIAKTRVAPLKPVSLPRLELYSTIVLSWIGSHASQWKTFVANRVAKIQTLSSATQWHHISGSANPADLATRGVSSSTLLTSIWLCGPKFLHETFPFQTDSSVPSLNDAVPEERYCTLQSIIVPNHLPDDHSNILRVGGRLRHANLAYGHKHPILLPKRHILTDLIIRHYHKILLHAGTQLVQSCIQEHYWIIGARDVIRHLIRKCVKCCKVKASITNPIMSDSPSSRISPAPAFMRCGVDYAGPFQIKIIKDRKIPYNMSIILIISNIWQHTTDENKRSHETSQLKA
ncbi:integrase catalytic domain-containing protein [Trichonephila clavata]|uniref:Integrase catalytic domain-containing protein n=1 Tax=Trichonephila clavata TaxID=2740835 RepID=A0A8X6EXZ7_TRICU|nr:integrase catalytic domain-containing protein [Trichonephila clavata]